MTEDARVIYESIPNGPISFGEVRKVFEEKMGRNMQLDEFSDLVKYKLIDLL